MKLASSKLMTIKPTQYIFPPRPQDAIPRDDTTLFATLGWIGQYKYNGTRCLIKFLPQGHIELWNRHGNKIRNYTAPDYILEQLTDVHARLGLDKDNWSLLDGELLDTKHAAIKDTIAIFDILVKDGQHLLGTTYQDRYDFLTGKLDQGEHWYYKTWDLGIKVTDNILIPKNHNSNTWPTLWDNINAINTPWTTGSPGDKNYSCHPLIEGLVLKDPDGKLEMGFREKNNSNWQTRSRVETGRHRF